MSERKTRFQKAMAGSFDDIDVFTNINEIRKLGNEIELLDVLILLLAPMVKLPSCYPE